MATDWLALWIEYESKTGKRPNQSNEDSKKIYAGVVNGANRNREGYREFLEKHKGASRGKDWPALWVAYEEKTGKRPSPSDPTSRPIYTGVLKGIKTGKEGYKEFFKEKNERGSRNIDWLALWLEYEKRTSQRPSESGTEESKRIYRSVIQGRARDKPGYAEFLEEHKVDYIDWLKLWVEYEQRTGKMPSTVDKDSAKIYRAVSKGSRSGRAGYKEFFNANRVSGRAGSIRPL